MYARLRLSELADRLRTAYEGFGRRDMDAVLSVMDPDIEWDATDALAHTGVYHGHDGVTEYIGSLSEAWTEFHLNPEQFTESGDGQPLQRAPRQPVRGERRAGHHRDPFRGICFGLFDVDHAPGGSMRRAGEQL